MPDLNMAERYADRVWILKAGRLIADASPREGLDSEMIRAVFGLDVRVESASSDGQPIILIEPAEPRQPTADTISERWRRPLDLNPTRMSRGTPLRRVTPKNRSGEQSSVTD
jgi:ABC-type multidrug transport system ATPase subunit